MGELDLKMAVETQYQLPEGSNQMRETVAPAR